MERPGCSGYSSFSYLNAPVGGKIKLKGAQTEGYVAKSSDTGSVTRYTPRQTKGAEYVAAYKAEEERKYLEVTFVKRVYNKRKEFCLLEVPVSRCPSFYSFFWPEIGRLQK